MGAGMNMGFNQGMSQKSAAAKRLADQEDQRQMMRSRFALAEAGDREGSASQLEDVFAHLSQPPEQMNEANTDLSMLLSNNPAISMEGIPAGQPAITPGAAQGMTSDPIRQALMARMLPREKKQFAPRAASRGSSRVFNPSAEMNRALDTVRENLGVAGRYAPMRPEQILAAHKLYEQAKRAAGKGEVTPEEMQALQGLGRKARAQGVQG